MPPVDWSDFEKLLRQIEELRREVEQLRRQLQAFQQERAPERQPEIPTAKLIVPGAAAEAPPSLESSIERMREAVEKAREKFEPAACERQPGAEKTPGAELTPQVAQPPVAEPAEVKPPLKPPLLKKEFLDFLQAEQKRVQAADTEGVVPAEGGVAGKAVSGAGSAATAHSGAEEAAFSSATSAASGATAASGLESDAAGPATARPPKEKFRLPAALSFLQPIADWFTPPPGQRFSVEEVLIRIFTVVAMIAAMFSAGYFSIWMQSRIPNIAKVGLLYLFAGGLLAGGWRTRAKLPRLSRPMLAGGLALAYFTSYAGHFIPATQAFGLGVSLALMTASLGALIVLAERLRSEMLAIFTVFLGYVTAYISGSSYFALLSNGGLALAAMIFLWRNRWVNLAAISVLGTYAFHLMWMLLWEHPAASAEQAFWINAGMLIGYFAIHQAGAMLSEIHQRELRRREYSRLLYMVWNAVIFWSLLMFVFFATQVYREQTEYLHFGYSAILFGLGFYYREQLTLLARFYFGLAVTLFTLGLIVALAGDARYLALTAESVLLLIAAYYLNLASLRRGALFVALVAFCILAATLLDNSDVLDANWRHPLFFRGLICALVWFGCAARYPALLRATETIPTQPRAAVPHHNSADGTSALRQTQPRGAAPHLFTQDEEQGRAFFGGWLLTWLGGISWLLLQAISLNHVWLLWLPLTVLALLIAGKGLRHPALLAFAGVFSAVHLLAGIFELRPHGGDSLSLALLGILISAAAGFYAEFTAPPVEHESAKRKGGLLVILPLSVAHLLYVELVLCHAPADWVLPLLWFALTLAVAPVLCFKTTRILLLVLIPFGALSARLAWELVDSGQTFVATRLYVLQHALSLLILAALPVLTARIELLLRKTKPAFESGGLLNVLLISPALLLPLACAKYFEPAGTIVALAALGIVAFVPVWIFSFRQYAFIGAGWLLLAHLALNIHALERLGWSNATYSLLLVALAALTIAQERIITFGFNKLHPDAAAGDADNESAAQSPSANPAKIPAKKWREHLQIYFGGLFFLLALNGLWNHPALHPQWVTVGWTLSGLAFFALGFALRLKFYPRVAFAILIAAIARAFLVDTQQLTERIYQIVAFLVLALILLAICYAFMKTKDQFENWN